jgi:hypothetical protein
LAVSEGRLREFCERLESRLEKDGDPFDGDDWELMQEVRVALGKQEPTMLTSSELRDQRRQYEQPPQFAYECYFRGEDRDDAEVVYAANEGRAAERHVQNTDEKEGFMPGVIHVLVRDVLGDRKWKMYKVDSIPNPTYHATEIKQGS